MNCSLLIENVCIVDGCGEMPRLGNIAICEDRIAAISNEKPLADEVFDGDGLFLAPGFIDVHTHDDLYLIRSPQMLPKLSQGVTTVIVGNCGISAAPVQLKASLPDPMNLLGQAGEFGYSTFPAYVSAIAKAKPAVNVAALVGHTALRNNHLDGLDRAATRSEVEAMKRQLADALEAGAMGLSTGLAYLSAYSASTQEVLGLARVLADAEGIYVTHLRSESDAIFPALEEAFQIGKAADAPVVISHLKCAGIDNWGQSRELLDRLEAARKAQAVACDCYPYSASSSTLDLRQVDERIKITITWSDPHPEMAGKNLNEIAAEWKMTQLEAARHLQPAGAIYHCISEDDMRAILRHPATMIGSDGLPCDPRPHPRLWGTFPRVLGKYARDENLFSMTEAVRKMTSLPAERFRLRGRGRIEEDCYADLVLFDPAEVRDVATFSDPMQPAAGIKAVWVNGALSYHNAKPTGSRAGKFLSRTISTRK